MHSSCSFYVCFILLNSFVFFSSVDGNPLAALGDLSSKFLDFIKPIEDAARFQTSLVKGASNFITQKIRTAIESGCKFVKSHKPLTLFTSLEETCLVNQTRESLKVVILNKITVATITGGVLGGDLYQLYSYSFSWRNSECGEAYDLQCSVIYFNLKYGSYWKALDHFDGIAMLNFPISTSGNFSNPIFEPFSLFLRSKLKGPGSHAKITTKFTYTWFVHFPFGSIYHTYVSPFRDEDTGKTTKALVIDLPRDPRVNYISFKQFHESFLKIAPSLGEFQVKDSGSSTVETQKGIVVLYLPA